MGVGVGILLLADRGHYTVQGTSVSQLPSFTSGDNLGPGDFIALRGREVTLPLAGISFRRKKENSTEIDKKEMRSFPVNKKAN